MVLPVGGGKRMKQRGPCVSRDQSLVVSHLHAHANEHATHSAAERINVVVGRG